MHQPDTHPLRATIMIKNNNANDAVNFHDDSNNMH